MKLSDVRLLVKDFDKSLQFYTEKLGLERLYNTDGYEAFKVSDSVELAIFVSDYQAMAVGNASKSLPSADYKDKSGIAFAVECVDTAYNALKANGVAFINEPFDWECAGIRCVHFRDPEGNELSLVNGGKDQTLRFASFTLLVDDFQKCVEFYSQKLGLERVYNTPDYEAFRVADGIDDAFALFTSDLNAETLGDTDKKTLTSTDFREKAMISFHVECVDTVYQALKTKGVAFINEPFDWKDAYMRAVHLCDPEGNLIEIHAGLACEE